MAGMVAALSNGSLSFSLVSPGGAAEELFRSCGITRTRRLPMRRFQRKGFAALWSQAMRWPRLNWSMFRLLRDLRPGVVHANGIQAMLHAALPAQLLGIPVIWHIRDLSRPRWAAWLCSRAASVLLAASKAAETEYGRMGKPLLRVPNPVSAGSAAPSHAGDASSESPADADGLFRIGLVGQIIPRKGHHVFLEATPRILERVPGARICFVGDDCFDPDSEYIEMLRERVRSSDLLRDRVEFRGSQADVAGWYAQLDLVVVPSLEEAFGRVALEAMAAGCPVAASRTGGLAETVEDHVNGLLFEPGDAEGLANAVVEAAISSELRRRLAEGGRETYSRYVESVEAGVGRVASLYRELSGAPKALGVEHAGSA